MGVIKKSNIILIAIFITVCFLDIPAVFAQDKQITPSRKLQMVNSAISTIYVDSVDDNALVETAIDNLLKQLDPFSTYLDANEAKKLNSYLDADFCGIGITYFLMGDSLIVTNVVSGGPAANSGVQASDRIVSIDSILITSKTNHGIDVKRMLSGVKGSKVELGIIHKGTNKLIKVEVVRDQIVVPSVASYISSHDVGYIKINSFTFNTAQEFDIAIKSLLRKSMKNLILDLRGNQGGYMDAGIAVANNFLNKGDIIVYTEGSHSPKREYRANGKGLMQTGSVVVLIDSKTASAAEIVAGAIQDWDRGKIIGQQSFGKGLTQRIINFSDGSILKLSNARYFTPSGRCIQKPYDSTEAVSTQKYYTLRQHKEILANGGIIPDYVVPKEVQNPYLSQIIYKGILSSSTNKYVDGHRESLEKRYKKFSNFEKDFKVPECLINEIKADAAQKKIDWPNNQTSDVTQQLQFLVKAFVAHCLWGTNEYQTILNDEDPEIKLALKEV